MNFETFFFLFSKLGIEGGGGGGGAGEKQRSVSKPQKKESTVSQHPPTPLPKNHQSVVLEDEHPHTQRTSPTSHPTRD